MIKARSLKKDWFSYLTTRFLTQSPAPSPSTSPTRLLGEFWTEFIESYLIWGGFKQDENYQVAREKVQYVCIADFLEKPNLAFHGINICALNFKAA